MADWWHKFPVICSIVSTGLGLKMMAEKQLSSMDKMRETISLLEAVKVPAEPADPSPSPAPVPQPAPAPKPVVKKILVMHTMNNCVWCRTDKAKIIPTWISLGYNVTYVDEGNGIPGNRYPWYEITDETNTRRIHVGTLGAFSR